ncbi:MAG TPA: hypothetical protein ENK18_20530 [Deltaproteobacteria bacterium]|nr:hypothetical protein [Deltaproteobacteria bacterium]
MAIRYDDEGRVLTCSVRDLIEEGAPAGHLVLEVVQRRAARAAAGRRVHALLQAGRAAEDERYRAEVSLERQVAIDAWTCVLQGRVDGLQEEDGHTLVEEIKSTVLDAARLHATTLQDWPTYLSQLEIYLWMLAEGGYASPTGRLVLVSLADGSMHVLGVEPQLARISRTVLGRLRGLVEARERRLTWLAQRRTRSVPCAHEAWRSGQEAIVEAVTRNLGAGNDVLVEAPTGLGKTAAALYGVLVHALAHDKQIFWATARTTQQAGAVRALGHLTAAGLPLRSVVLTAKDKACLNEIVSCRPDVCPYAEGYYDKLRSSGLLLSLADRGAHLPPELLSNAGAHYTVCPFEIALDLSSHVDVVVGDYNYVFDPSVQLRRHFNDGDASGWIVVVDEVHQLAERARGYSSPRVEVAVAREASRQLRAAGRRYQPFALMAEEIEAAILAEVQVTEGQEAVCEPDLDRWRVLGARLDEVGLDYALLKAESAAAVPSSEDAWLHLARQVLRLASGLESPHEAIVPVVGRARDREHMGLLCLDPSPWLGPQLRRLGGFVGLSATLRPHAFHRDLLGLDPERLEVVEVPSPFPPERRRVLVAPQISTAYADRRRDAPATAELMRATIEAVPGNVAIYFPSFAMLEDLVGRLELPGRRILAQSRRMGPAARRALLDALDDGGAPVALAAVLGGIYAEGIDLPPGALSAVMVVGPALPPIGLERDLLRGFYEETYGSGFLYASLVPGITRVVQAAGRLIRRPEDRGVIVLLGRRFRWRDVQQLLPPSFEPRVSRSLPDEVEAFFAGPVR